MAQEMIVRKQKIITKTKNISTQTDENTDEFCIYISKNKTFRLYYSKTYKSSVLSFNFGNSKKYIITKPMWKIFRKYIPHIDKILIEYNQNKISN